MSSLSLQTGTGSSSTLLYGMEITNLPLPDLLALKEEPGDDEEAAMQAELKARRSHRKFTNLHDCILGIRL